MGTSMIGLSLVMLVLLLAFIPARIAWTKHRSFARWYALSMLVFVPAFIASLVMDDLSFHTLAKRAWGDDWKAILSKQRSTPTDSGWYANGNHEDTLQWWDGTEWVAAWRRVDGSTLPRPAGEDAWDPTERLIGSMWTQAASTARDYGQAFLGKSR